MIKFIKEKILFQDAVCPWWLAYTFDNPGRRIFHDPVNLLKDYVKNGMTVLDAGCGMGYFSIAMAKLVGESGKVIAMDIQEKMIEVMKKRAKKAGILNRIIPCLNNNKLRLKYKVDFALGFYVVHEVSDKKDFLMQIYKTLKPKGQCLIAEPILHSSRKYFEELERTCISIGFKIKDKPDVSISRAILLAKR